MDFRLEYVGPHGLHTPDGPKTKGEEFTADEQWMHGNAHLILGPNALIKMVNRDRLRTVQLTKRAPALYDHDRELREPGDVFEATEIWLASKCALLRSGRMVEAEPAEPNDEVDVEEIEGDEADENKATTYGEDEMHWPEDTAERLKALGWPTLQKLTSALRERTDGAPEAQGTDPYIAFALKHHAATIELLPEFEG